MEISTRFTCCPCFVTDNSVFQNNSGSFQTTRDFSEPSLPPATSRHINPNHPATSSNSVTPAPLFVVSHPTNSDMPWSALSSWNAPVAAQRQLKRRISESSLCARLRGVTCVRMEAACAHARPKATLLWKFLYGTLEVEIMEGSSPQVSTNLTGVWRWERM